MDGIWIQGECRDKQYVFNDGLNFLETDWKYCKFPDRRLVKHIELLKMFLKLKY